MMSGQFRWARKQLPDGVCHFAGIFCKSTKRLKTRYFQRVLEWDWCSVRLAARFAAVLVSLEKKAKKSLL